MGIPNLFQHFGWWSVALPGLGLALSFAFRGRRWGVLFWLPTTAACLYQTAWLGMKVLALGAVRGPDAIGVGIAYMMLVPAFIGGGGALVGCFFARPTKAARHPGPFAAAAALCVGIAFLFDRDDGVTFALTFLDEENRPLAHVPVAIPFHEGGLSAGGVGEYTNADGEVSFRLREGLNATVEFRPPLPMDKPWSVSPIWWTVRIRPDAAAQRIELWHHWQRSLGGTSLDEATREFVPAAKAVAFTVVVPRRCALGVPALEDRVRASLAAGLDPEMVCRNVEAIACTSELIARSNVAGLKHVASMLAQLDSARRKLQGLAAQPLQHGENYLAGEFLNEMASLARWSGSSDLEPMQVLQAAEAKIDQHVQQLTAFALATRSTSESMAEILWELRGCREHVGVDVLRALAQQPPKTARALQGWGRTLWTFTRQGHRLEYVRELFASDEAALVLLACEAMGNQLESEGGEFALERLRAVRPTIQDKDMAARADMFIADLTFRLRKVPSSGDSRPQP